MRDAPAGQDDTLAHRLLGLIEHNYQNGITLAVAAKELGYSYQYLSRYVNRQFGLSFCEMVAQYRVERAMYLLKNTCDSITSIASECGYDSLRTFNRNFQSITRTTPRAYRCK